MRSSSRSASRGTSGRPLPEIIREIASLSDGAVFSSKKDHFVPIGGMLCLNDDDVAQRARELLVVYEGFLHYGGMAGHDMEALAQGIRESADERIVAAYVAQARYLGGRLEERDVPIVEPVGAHAVFLDAKRFLPHLPQTGSRRSRSPPRSTSRAGCGRWSVASSRASTATSPTTASSSSG